MPFTCFSSPDSRRLENFPLACLNALVELSDALLSFVRCSAFSRTPCGFTTDTAAAFEAVIGCGHPLSIEIEAKAKASPFIRLKPTTASVTPYLGQGDAARGHQIRDATTHAYYYKYCYVRTLRETTDCTYFLLSHDHGKAKNFLLSRVKYSIIEPNQKKSRPKSTTRELDPLFKLASGGIH